MREEEFHHQHSNKLINQVRKNVLVVAKTAEVADKAVVVTLAQVVVAVMACSSLCVSSCSGARNDRNRIKSGA